MSTSPVRVLVISDWALFRQGLLALLRGVGGVEIVGEACDAQNAVHQAGFTRADVILLTLMQPGIQPVEAIRCLIEARPGTSVLVLGGLHSDETLLQAVRAGAVGCLRSDIQSLELARAIHAIHRGEAWVTPAIAMRILRDIHHPGQGLSAAGSARGEPLTPRETQVLRLLADGLPNKLIAGRLSVSEATVRTHVCHILAKLHVQTRVQAALLARGQGG
jgi:DNA-binding NarL/FixJ family response regulator